MYLAFLGGVRYESSEYDKLKKTKNILQLHKLQH